MITNAHVHTPYTFSPFESIEQLVRTARHEGIVALGINDLNTLDGFREFAGSCTRHGVYPLFNIEFDVRCETGKHGIGIRHSYGMPELQTIHGKALRFPASLTSDSRNLIASIWKESQDRIWKKIDSLNLVLQNRSFTFILDYNRIRTQFAKTSLLEQHVAQAIHEELRRRYGTGTEFTDALRRLFEDPSFEPDPDDGSLVQKEILTRLLSGDKVSGGPGSFRSTMNFFEARQVILGSGGIPCYHCSFRQPPHSSIPNEPEQLAQHLADKGIHAIEFTPHQTDFATLYRWMSFFHQHHFCVTVGTEHCGPQAHTLVPSSQDGRPLDEKLISISYEGACILAAHQELHNQKRHGFVDESGKRLVGPDQLAHFIRTGNEAIENSCKR